jgi:hypothetical protein
MLSKVFQNMSKTKSLSFHKHSVPHFAQKPKAKVSFKEKSSGGNSCRYRRTDLLFALSLALGKATKVETLPLQAQQS